MKFTSSVDSKDIQKRIKDLGKRVEPHDFDEWANRIIKTAKEKCNDHDCKRIKLKSTENKSFNCDFTDKEAIDCVIDAIKQHLNSMPFSLQLFYKQSIPNLEAKKGASV